MHLLIGTSYLGKPTYNLPIYVSSTKKIQIHLM
jgi:hypothetical protein